MDAVDGAAAGEKQAEVVVDFGGGGDGGARVARGVFLLDGDGGREAVDEVDVGLVDALEELAGVGGERLDVAALALGVDGVKGEGGFAGAGDAGDDREHAVRDGAVDGFEIVGPRSADDDGVVQARFLWLPGSLGCVEIGLASHRREMTAADPSIINSRAERSGRA